MDRTKRKPIAVGDRVWILRMITLVHGDVPRVSAARVNAIGKEASQAGGKRSYRTIYNCKEAASGRKNVLVSREGIRPYTKQGKAELLRMLVSSLNEESHRYRQASNACLDLAGHYHMEIANLEGGNRGKAHRTNTRAAKRVGRVARKQA